MHIPTLLFTPHKLEKIAVLFISVHFFFMLPMGPLPLCNEINLKQGKRGYSRPNPSDCLRAMMR